MKKIQFIILVALLGFSNLSVAQKYITKTGDVIFYSDTPLETIEAKNNQVNCALNAETGDFVFKILIKSFEFEQALMQEHFNENYMESSIYPNSTFKGKVINMDEIDLASPGSVDIQVKGDLSIHGITKEIETEGTFIISENNIQGKAVFDIAPEDYNIKIPSAIAQNIAEVVEITVNIDLNKYEQVAKK